MCKSNAKADKKLIFTSPTSIIWNGNYILIGWKNNYLPAKLHFSGLWSFLSIIFANLAWEYSRNSDSDINHPVPSISSKIFHTREFSLDENHFASKNNADRRPIVVVRQKCSVATRFNSGFISGFTSATMWYDSLRQMLSVAKGFNIGFNSVPRELNSLKTKVFGGDGIQLRTDRIWTGKIRAFGTDEFPSFNSLKQKFSYRWD